MQDTESAETLGSSMEDPSLVVNINKQHHKDQVREATRGPRITRNMMLPPPCITCILHPHRTACHKLFIPSASPTPHLLQPPPNLFFLPGYQHPMNPSTTDSFSRYLLNQPPTLVHPLTSSALYLPNLGSLCTLLLGCQIR